MSQSDGISPESFAAPEERRRHRRRSGFWSAQLETTAGQRLDCIVLDISDGGARLRIKHPVLVGDVMTLSGKRFAPCGVRVAWVAHERAGVVFLSPVDAAQDGSEPAFLRHRAAVLRRMAQLAEAGDTGARLMRLAEALDAKAEQFETRQLQPPLSVRRDRGPALVDQ